MSVPTENLSAHPPFRATPTFREAVLFWLKLGFISFGGPAGQIAILHTELVEKRRWISETRFLHALNYCMLLPGPEAQQLTTYIGWLLHGTKGGIVAGALFVLPSALILWLLSLIYAVHGQASWMIALFDGLKPAVLAIVLTSVVRIGRRALKTPWLWAVAGLSFILLSALHVPFPVLVVGAALLGTMTGRWKPAWLGTTISVHAETVSNAEVDACTPTVVEPTLSRALRVGATCLLLWWGPIAIAALWFGRDHLLVQQGLFFSQAAMVTFGGAYAVLPYVSQQAVEVQGWVTPGQMLDGLGLAETTPGPLIMVLQFVGFLGGWKFHAPLSPWIMASMGGLMTTWTTFLPSFLWILLGAPHVEKLRENKFLKDAMVCITASVVGVILNLAVWLGLHVLFPTHQPVNALGIAIFIVSWFALTYGKLGVLPVVALAGILGGATKLFLAS